MSDAENLLGWAAILVVVAGALSVFFKVRDWYRNRGHPGREETEWPQTRFSLRRDK